MNPERIESHLKPLRARFEELERRMHDPGFPMDPAFAELAREHRLLKDKMDLAAAWETGRREIAHLQEMARSEDKELAELAQAEQPACAARVADLEGRLLKALTPRDPNDAKNVVLEVRAGTGGEEAALFAAELARMYLRFAERNGLRVETVEWSPTGRGGTKEAILLIESRPDGAAEVGPFGLLKYERGVHRVQRVPETEASGRIHTSAVTVAVLPEAEEVDVQVKPEELRVDTYRASGHGGQHLQKTDSAVRITHLPTGLVVQCQDERSQQKNREKAMKILRARLYEVALQEQEKKIARDRKKQVGTGDRSEKIRTYNFPQDRITDHRIGLSVHHIQDVLDGNLASLVDALRRAEEVPIS